MGPLAGPSGGGRGPAAPPGLPRPRLKNGVLVFGGHRRPPPPPRPPRRREELGSSSSSHIFLLHVQIDVDVLEAASMDAAAPLFLLGGSDDVKGRHCQEVEAMAAEE